MRKIRKMCRYSEEFNRELVRLFEQGKYSDCQMERLYGVTNNTIYRWICQYATCNEKGYRINNMKTVSGCNTGNSEKPVTGSRRSR